jgi:16S rRNA C1402 (ribose-2'-O) methylase RsmI
MSAEDKNENKVLRLGPIEIGYRKRKWTEQRQALEQLKNALKGTFVYRTAERLADALCAIIKRMSRK